MGVAQSVGDSRFKPNFHLDDQSFARTARLRKDSFAQGLKIDNYISTACAVKARRDVESTIQRSLIWSICGEKQ
jgi:hypothetical protein